MDASVFCTDDFSIYLDSGTSAQCTSILIKILYVGMQDTLAWLKNIIITGREC